MNKYIDISNISMPHGLPKINFNKRAGNYEISCSLLSLCNLRCKFCFQDHDCNNISIDKMMELPDLIINTISNDIIDYDIKDKIFIRLYGGELFFDGISDELFNKYERFANKLINLLNMKFPSCDVEIYWGSNGVFTKYERVCHLLKQTNSKIALSYDSSDRFTTDKQKEIWYNTFKHFYNLGMVSSVSIMLIKPAIEKYMSGDEYFHKIPKDICIDVNQYISNPGYEKYQVNDTDIFKFYKWCIDNEMFNVDPVNHAIKNFINKYGERHCYCKCSNFFNTDGYHTKNCINKYSQLPVNEFYNLYTNEVNESNCTEVKNSLGMTKRGCLYCEHYEYCPMFCWASLIHSSIKPETCPLQSLFKYIDDNPEMIERFKMWGDSYGSY